MILAKLTDFLELDDVTESISVHLGGGFIGLFAVAFYNETDGIFIDNSTDGKILLHQMAGFGVLVPWAFVWTLVIFVVMSYLKLLRESLKTEIIGYDYIDFTKDMELRPGAKLSRKTTSKVARFLQKFSADR